MITIVGCVPNSKSATIRSDDTTRSTDTSGHLQRGGGGGGGGLSVTRLWAIIKAAICSNTVHKAQIALKEIAEPWYAWLTTEWVFQMYC